MVAKQRPLVSVVIPTLNAGAGLARLLEVIQGQRIEGELEVIVIDSESKDGTAALAHQAGAKVLTCPRREFSHGRTRNQAIETATGTYVALTVQDALPTDSYWLARLIEPLAQKSTVAGSYGLQVAPPTAGLLAKTRSSLWCQVNRAPVTRALKDPDQFRKMVPEERLKLIRFDNVCACIKRGVWEKIPLPERNFAEDMAWARAALLEGYEIAYVPTAQVWHCHERGRLYELRRAYIDGVARVQVAGWPTPRLEKDDLVDIGRRTLFFFRTRRFDRLVDPKDIRHFLLAERWQYEELEPSKPTNLYIDILIFATALTRRALAICPDGVFPEGAWIELFRFATAAVVGHELGSAAQAEPSGSTGMVWNLIGWFLGQGV